jgi:hypothetical protein
MSITKDTIKETIKTIMAEEGDYKAFFKKALEKAGKSIPSMSDEEKKEFFNKIDAAWDGKGEKNEGNAFGAAVTKAKEKGEDEFEVDGKTYKVESVNEAKSITLITYGGKKTKYNNSDINGFISNLNLSSEDLPGLIYKASMGNSNIIGTRAKSYNKKKEAILKLLNKIKSHSGNVVIDVDSKKPSYKQSIKFESVNEVNESHSDCGCGCGGVTEGGCSTNLPIELSEELTFEINTFLERPVLSKNNNKITVENSELSNLIPTLVNNEIHKRLSSGVKKEFIELLKNYK